MTDSSYVVKKVDKVGGVPYYSVRKYIGDSPKETYEVKGSGSCDCPGFKVKQKRGGVCKHVSMVMQFDSDALASASTAVTGVRDEVAQEIYERVTNGVGPFMETISLKEMRRNPNTDGVVSMVICASPHKHDAATVTKLTGFIDNVMVELLIE